MKRKVRGGAGEFVETEFGDVAGHSQSDIVDAVNKRGEPMRAKILTRDQFGQPLTYAPNTTGTPQAIDRLVVAMEARARDIDMDRGARSSEPWPYGSQVRELLKMQGPIKQLGEKRPAATRGAGS